MKKIYFVIVYFVTGVVCIASQAGPDAAAGPPVKVAVKHIKPVCKHGQQERQEFIQQAQAAFLAANKDIISPEDAFVGLCDFDFRAGGAEWS